jgi:hypothetical protein
LETQAEHRSTKVLNQGTSRITINHDTIRDWIEDRNGYPAAVKSISSSDDPNPLRVEFSGYRGNEWLQPISWQAFFDYFEDQNLAFLYQDSASDGTLSRFYRFVPRR